MSRKIVNGKIGSEEALRKDYYLPEYINVPICLVCNSLIRSFSVSVQILFYFLQSMQGLKIFGRDFFLKNRPSVTFI